ncbi:DB module domain-containing protein [Ditylenchus destructor]|uniref:DB module domain-containing protein n=1 Tax=Ditylenchus destructor TaxID=166010 RepID=A0AAD4R3U1_9BILA|nr:DB module domain-containing protein [Ditylenchus destructor]KAI1708100.1 DB module domain-containing protein [Ditylenchus destructor]KAI1708102.1 DB module domain-containing protein [Ditylenchus destructor]
MFKSLFCASILLAVAFVALSSGANPNTNEVLGIHNCVSQKGKIDPEVLSDPQRYADAILECLNGDKDNTECCRDHGISGHCLALCNGTVPQTLPVPEFEELNKCDPKVFECTKYKLT